jgi:hypothetical protein
VICKATPQPNKKEGDIMSGFNIRFAEASQDTKTSTEKFIRVRYDKTPTEFVGELERNLIQSKLQIACPQNNPKEVMQ